MLKFSLTDREPFVPRDASTRGSHIYRITGPSKYSSSPDRHIIPKKAEPVELTANLSGAPNRVHRCVMLKNWHFERGSSRVMGQSVDT